MEDFHIDESRWPIVVIKYPSTITIERYRAVFTRFVEFSQRGEQVGYLIDMRAFNPLSATAAHRKAAADVFAANRHSLITWTRCEARVVSNKLTSGVLTAFDWLTGQKWPCANFASMSEAERWVTAQMSLNPNREVQSSRG